MNISVLKRSEGARLEIGVAWVMVWKWDAFAAPRNLGKLPYTAAKQKQGKTRPDCLLRRKLRSWWSCSKQRAQLIFFDNWSRENALLVARLTRDFVSFPFFPQDDHCISESTLPAASLLVMSTKSSFLLCWQILLVERAPCGKTLVISQSGLSHIPWQITYCFKTCIFSHTKAWAGRLTLKSIMKPNGFLCLLYFLWTKWKVQHGLFTCWRFQSGDRMIFSSVKSVGSFLSTTGSFQRLWKLRQIKDLSVGIFELWCFSEMPVPGLLTDDLMHPKQVRRLSRKSWYHSPSDKRRVKLAIVLLQLFFI